jgi:probable rRNA maturation factor
MLTVINLQRTIKVDITAFAGFGKILAATVDEASDKRASVAFISDRRMRELNAFFRGQDHPTDVLSFPFEPDEFEPDETNLGDIVISAETAERQASQNGLTFDGEVKQLILHGLLHLCGYDHETDNGEMNRRELELRDKLGI